MTETKTQPTRRDFISMTAYAMAAIGVGGAGWVLIDSMNPAADTLVRDVTSVDLKPITPGKRVMVAWQGHPVFIYHRTEEDIREIRAEDWHSLRDPQSDEARVKKGYDEWLVVIGLCTLHGCLLMGNRENQPRGKWGGWYCPCCGASYDKSGRARNWPAPKNLPVLDYEFLTENVIRIRTKAISETYKKI